MEAARSGGTMPDTSSPGGPFGGPGPDETDEQTRAMNHVERGEAGPPNTAWSAPDSGWEAPRAAGPGWGPPPPDAGWSPLPGGGWSPPAPPEATWISPPPEAASPYSNADAGRRGELTPPAPFRARRRQRPAARHRRIPWCGDQSRLLAVARLHGGADAAGRPAPGRVTPAARPLATAAAPGRATPAACPSASAGLGLGRLIVWLRLRATSDVTSIASAVDPALVDINVTLGYQYGQAAPPASS